MTDLTSLLRAEAAHAPAHPDDLTDVLATGRRRVRRRRSLAASGSVLAAGALVAAGLVTTTAGDESIGPAATGLPTPVGPRIELASPVAAVEGIHYDVIATQRNDDLESENGTYLRGVTEDGRTLVQDGPSLETNETRWGLRDADGAVDWLPERLGKGTYVRPLQLTRERLVLASTRMLEDPEAEDGVAGLQTTIEVFDRSSRTWSSRALPEDEAEGAMEIGPDGRLWFTERLTEGGVPEGGWPTGPDGVADDSDAAGDTFRLLSMDLDGAKEKAPRIEVKSMGSFGFGDRTLVWTDATHGRPGQVHVRDLGGGWTRSFNPRTGERCNLLGFAVAGERISLTQYCGKYGGRRDDRVQVVTTDGDQVGTFQGGGLSGGLTGPDGRFLQLQPHDDAAAGTYLVDLDDEARTTYRLSTGTSRFATGATHTPAGSIVFSRPVNGLNGDETTVVRWRD